eukprot:jgi/Mesvir1/635/Mv17251-RA.1
MHAYVVMVGGGGGLNASQVKWKGSNRGSSLPRFKRSASSRTRAQSLSAAYPSMANPRHHFSSPHPSEGRGPLHNSNNNNDNDSNNNYNSDAHADPFHNINVGAVTHRMTWDEFFEHECVLVRARGGAGGSAGGSTRGGRAPGGGGVGVGGQNGGGGGWLQPWDVKLSVFQAPTDKAVGTSKAVCLAETYLNVADYAECLASGPTASTSGTCHSTTAVPPSGPLSANGSSGGANGGAAGEYERMDTLPLGGRLGSGAAITVSLRIVQLSVEQTIEHMSQAIMEATAQPLAKRASSALSPDPALCSLSDNAHTAHALRGDSSQGVNVTTLHSANVMTLHGNRSGGGGGGGVGCRADKGNSLEGTSNHFEDVPSANTVVKGRSGSRGSDRRAATTNKDTLESACLIDARPAPRHHRGENPGGGGAGAHASSGDEGDPGGACRGSHVDGHGGREVRDAGHRGTRHVASQHRDGDGGADLFSPLDSALSTRVRASQGLQGSRTEREQASEEQASEARPGGHHEQSSNERQHQASEPHDRQNKGHRHSRTTPRHRSEAEGPSSMQSGDPSTTRTERRSSTSSSSSILPTSRTRDSQDGVDASAAASAGDGAHATVTAASEQRRMSNASRAGGARDDTNGASGGVAAASSSSSSKHRPRRAASAIPAISVARMHDGHDDDAAGAGVGTTAARGEAEGAARTAADDREGAGARQGTLLVPGSFPRGEGEEAAVSGEAYRSNTRHTLGAPFDALVALGDGGGRAARGEPGSGHRSKEGGGAERPLRGVEGERSRPYRMDGEGGGREREGGAGGGNGGERARLQRPWVAGDDAASVPASMTPNHASSRAANHHAATSHAFIRELFDHVGTRPSESPPSSSLSSSDSFADYPGRNVQAGWPQAAGALLGDPHAVAGRAMPSGNNIGAPNAAVPVPTVAVSSSSTSSTLLAPFQRMLKRRESRDRDKWADADASRGGGDTLCGGVERGGGWGEGPATAMVRADEQELGGGELKGSTVGGAVAIDSDEDGAGVMVAATGAKATKAGVSGGKPHEKESSDGAGSRYLDSLDEAAALTKGADAPAAQQQPVALPGQRRRLSASNLLSRAMSFRESSGAKEPAGGKDTGSSKESPAVLSTGAGGTGDKPSPSAQILGCATAGVQPRVGAALPAQTVADARVPDAREGTSRESRRSESKGSGGKGFIAELLSISRGAAQEMQPGVQGSMGQGAQQQVAAGPHAGARTATSSFLLPFRRSVSYNFGSGGGSSGVASMHATLPITGSDIPGIMSTCARSATPSPAGQWASHDAHKEAGDAAGTSAADAAGVFVGIVSSGVASYQSAGDEGDEGAGLDAFAMQRADVGGSLLLSPTTRSKKQAFYKKMSPSKGPKGGKTKGETAGASSGTRRVSRVLSLFSSGSSSSSSSAAAAAVASSSVVASGVASSSGAVAGVPSAPHATSAGIVAPPPGCDSSAALGSSGNGSISPHAAALAHATRHEPGLRRPAGFEGLQIQPDGAPLAAFAFDDPLALQAALLATGPGTPLPESTPPGEDGICGAPAAVSDGASISSASGATRPGQPSPAKRRSRSSSLLPFKWGSSARVDSKAAKEKQGASGGGGTRDGVGAGEMAAGAGACTAIAVLVSEWLLRHQGQLPNRAQFDSLIVKGSAKWRALCETDDHRGRFADNHFDLETVVAAGITNSSDDDDGAGEGANNQGSAGDSGSGSARPRPSGQRPGGRKGVRIDHDGSFVGFFRPVLPLPSDAATTGVTTPQSQNLAQGGTGPPELSLPSFQSQAVASGVTAGMTSQGPAPAHADRAHVGGASGGVGMPGGQEGGGEGDGLDCLPESVLGGANRTKAHASKGHVAARGRELAPLPDLRVRASGIPHDLVVGGGGTAGAFVPLGAIPPGDYFGILSVNSSSSPPAESISNPPGDAHPLEDGSGQPAADPTPVEPDGKPPVTSLADSQRLLREALSELESFLGGSLSLEAIWGELAKRACAATRPSRPFALGASISGGGTSGIGMTSHAHGGRGGNGMGRVVGGPGAGQVGSRHVYIVSWNDHFFVLSVETGGGAALDASNPPGGDAGGSGVGGVAHAGGVECVLIDTLGERLHEGCTRAFMLRFGVRGVTASPRCVKSPSGTRAHAPPTADGHSSADLNNEGRMGVENRAGDTAVVNKHTSLGVGGETSSGHASSHGMSHAQGPPESDPEAALLACPALRECQRFVTEFLAAVPLRELTEEMMKKGMLPLDILHKRLQIEFHSMRLC